MSGHSLDDDRLVLCLGCGMQVRDSMVQRGKKRQGRTLEPALATIDGWKRDPTRYGVPVNDGRVRQSECRCERVGFLMVFEGLITFVTRWVDKRIGSQYRHERRTVLNQQRGDILAATASNGVVPAKVQSRAACIATSLIGDLIAASE